MNDTPSLNDELATMISDLSHTGELSMPYRMEIADRLTALRTALSTPANEPQGYVEGLEAACRFADQVSRDLGWHRIYDVTGAALAARPAPQPAADTRVTDAMIVKIWELAQQYDDDAEFMALVRAIIGTAIPAPSDKIAEAAIDRCMQEIEDIICEADVSYPAGRDAGTSIDFDRDAVLAALRALAGKGE